MKWAATWQNQQSDCGPSEDSDQPGHPPSLIRVFVARMEKAWVHSHPLSAWRRLWSDWADAQADLSLRLAQSLCWFCHVAAQMLCWSLFTFILDKYLGPLPCYKENMYRFLSHFWVEKRLLIHYSSRSLFAEVLMKIILLWLRKYVKKRQQPEW